MKRLCTLGLIIALAAGVRAEVTTTPQTSVPKGDYAIARLELPAGLNGGAHPLLLGFRDGKLVNFWFVTGQNSDKRLHLEESTVARQGAAIAGKVHIRSAVVAGSFTISDRVSGSLTLDLKVEGAKITGTYEVDLTGTVYKSGKGTVTGTWQTKGEPLAAAAA